MEKKRPVQIKYEDQEVKVQEVQTIDKVWGLFRTVSSAPNGKPVKFADQVVIYTNSTTYRLYWYDTNADVWHYVTATA